MHAQVFMKQWQGEGRKMKSFFEEQHADFIDIVCEVQIYITHIQSQIGGRMIARTMFFLHL